MQKNSLLRITFLLIFSSCFVFSQDQYWKKSKKDVAKKYLETLRLKEDKITVFELDINSFKRTAFSSSLQDPLNKSLQTTISVPDIEGNLHTFVLNEVSNFSSELAVKYSNIKSYIGYNSFLKARLRMSLSPHGIDVMVKYHNKPTEFIKSAYKGSNLYVIYNKTSKTTLKEIFDCKTYDKLQGRSQNNNATNLEAANDQKLRIFKLAISTTGEYTAYHGGSVADALAAINTTLTRVNEVFETDMAITFRLIEATTNVIFTDPNTDPYSSEEDPINWNTEVQNVLSSTIGEANYDIGHLLAASGGYGDAGCIGCVCNDGNKGSAATSPADGIPEGDTFDIDYVSHEIAHQMGAHHTFSHIDEFTNVQVEPGSGSTIMSYAGISGSNNVQLNSDPYFNTYSIHEVLTNLASKSPCWTETPIANNPPIANAGSDFTIPKGTPYKLMGSATDLDNFDSLSYCWEQIDNGRVRYSDFGPTLETGAMARSLPPTTSPERYIPKLSRVVAGQLTEIEPEANGDWETVSEVGRTINWALTVRDRDPIAINQGGQSDSDTMTITVDDTSEPFRVTSPFAYELWLEGTTQTVRWEVSNTNAPPISVSTVNIKLSVDNGLTFPIILASNVPNDGQQEVTIPTGINISEPLVMVESVGNIFYAVNAFDADLISEESARLLIYNTPNSNSTFSFTFYSPPSEVVTLDVYDILGRTIYNNTYSTTGKLTESVTLSNISSGIYFIAAQTSGIKIIKKVIFNSN